MSTETKPTPQPLKTSVVKVIKEGLTHQGKSAAVDSEITVTEGQLAFLRKKGFVAPAADTKATKGT